MLALSTVARIGSRRFTASKLVVASAGRWQALSTIKFAKSHEYIKIDGDIGTVGITSHAADALGDVVYVDLPSVGASYDAGDSFGSVESVKAASDVYTPVGGEVVEVNAELESNPGTVNESAMEDGWFMKIKIANEAELNDLMDQDAYDKEIDE